MGVRAPVVMKSLLSPVREARCRPVVLPSHSWVIGPRGASGVTRVGKKANLVGPPKFFQVLDDSKLSNTFNLINPRVIMDDAAAQT